MGEQKEQTKKTAKIFRILTGFFICLVIASVATNVVLDAPQFWSLMELRGKSAPDEDQILPTKPWREEKTFGIPAREAGLIS